ncbi:MAG: hypothetical protein WAO55_09730 [Candidatus Manganitrophaceae bacterium]
MKKTYFFTLGILGLSLVASTAFAQNISTNTTSTTVGSTQFGFVINAAGLGAVMQANAAPTCTGPSNNQVCTLVGADTIAGTGDDFVRVNALPGAHTSTPFNQISTLPNFACGPTATSNNCILNMNNTDGTGGPQTAPNFTGRTLVGTISTNANLGGDTTPGMPTGFMKFTLNVPGGGGAATATIDQLIQHTVELTGAVTPSTGSMTFAQRDATIGLNNPIGTPGDATTIDDVLTLVPFTPSDTQTGLPSATTGMVSRLALDQGNADGFGALGLDMTVNFPLVGATGTGFPSVGQFVTPGLNTGIDFTGNSIPNDNMGFP